MTRLLTCLLLLAYPLSALANPPASPRRVRFPRPGRKIIVYGWELGFREVSDIRRNAQVMQRQPFDGIMFSLFHKGLARDKAFIHSGRLTDAQLAPAVKELAAIRWTTFTDNFLMVKAGEKFLENGEPDRMDWFDDRQWETICHNIGVMTRAAVATRCVGLGFDPEPYHTSAWNYDQAGSRKPQPHRDTKTFAEYVAVVRRRGGQYMQAIQSEMPGVRIFNLYQAIRIPPSELAETIYSLYPAFINGMLDVAGPNVRFIDGNEYGFSLLTRGDYTNAYVNVKERKLALIDPKNRETYRRQVQVSVPIYLDDIFGSHKKRRWIGTYLTPENKQKLFEHKLFQALDAVDEYVWVYGERPAWFSSAPRVPRWATQSVKTVKQQVERLRLEARPKNTSLIKRVREQIAVRDKELAGLNATQRQTPRLPSSQAMVPRLPGGVAPPTINGTLDDPAWKHATVLTGFRPLLYFIRDQRAVDTTCRAMWDDRFLYLGFKCQEPRIAELAQSATNRQRNRNSLVMSKSAAAQSFVRLDVPLEGPSNRMARKPGTGGWAIDKTVGRRLSRGHQISDTMWTAEWRVPWSVLGGVPKTGDTRRATVTRVRSPWAEHDSWAPQIDPNLIDDKLLGTWVFGSR